TRSKRDWSSDVCSSDLSELAFEKMPTKLLEGRLPTNDEEIIISEKAISEGKLDFKVGDQLKFGIGDRVTTDEDYSDNYLGQDFRSEERRVGKEGKSSGR